MLDVNNNLDREWTLVEGEEAMKGIMKLFFSNQFEEATKTAHAFKNTSLFHSLGLCAMKFCAGVLTLEKVSHLASQLN